MNYKIKRLLREASYRYHDHFVFPQIAKRNAWYPNINNKNIYVFSSPRGGSTWLTEILTNIPNAVSVWEPLFQYKNKYPELARMPFYWNTHIPESFIWPEAYDFFKRLFNREILYSKLLWMNSLSQVADAEYFVYKFCYGQLLIPWLVKNFDIKPILLMRHPCAVIASQMHRGFTKGKWQFYAPIMPFNEIFTKYNHLFPQINTPEERLSAVWSITNKYAYDYATSSDKCLIVFYEELIINPEKELRKIFNWLNISDNNINVSPLKKPSKTTDSYALKQVGDGITQLHKWKTQLNNTQIQNILKVVNELFGFTIYTEHSMPLNDISI